MNDNVEDVNYKCEGLIDDNDKLRDRIDVLEDELKGMKAENNELRECLNATTQELNNVIDLLNARYNVN